MPYVLATLTALTATFVGCYRPGVATRPARIDPALNELASNALSNRNGTLLVIDPKSGRILNRVANSADVQFETPPFGLSQIITAYTALASGAITDKTLLPCDASGKEIDIVQALADGCSSFFRTLSEKIDLERFSRNAETLGFVYYRIENVSEGSQVVRPIGARLPTQLRPEEFAELAAEGQAMLARDLHFAGLVTTLATGTTSVERFARYITTAARGPAPPTEPLNASALATIRRALVKAVDSGELAGAATIGEIVAAAAGEQSGRAILISFAPANVPDVCLVINLNEGGRRAAADVAGRFYKAYFRKK